jgi:amino acid transporter
MTPLGGVTSGTSLGFALGGPALVGMYVLVALVVLCFGIVYATMAGEIRNAGAFYACVTRGLGRPLGLAAGSISLLIYNGATVFLCAMFGFYAQTTFSSQLGINIPWPVWSFAVIIATFLLGRRQVDVSANLLALAVVLETAVLAILDVTVLWRHGIKAFDLSVLSPTTIASGSTGALVIFGFYGFGSLEATAIFSEEARDPRHTIRRATVFAVLLTCAFYVVNAWCLAAAVGTSSVQAMALADPANFVFIINTSEVGQWSTDVMQWLLFLSLFAALLGTHNVANRYFFSLGRDGVLPTWLGKTHPKTQAPHNAGIVQTAILVVVLGLFIISGADPIAVIVASVGGITTLGVMIMYGMVSLAGFFYFRGRTDRSLFVTTIGPIVATVSLLFLTVLGIRNYDLLTGVPSGLVNQVPWLLPIIAAASVAYALWLRNRKPLAYASIGAGASDNEEDSKLVATLTDGVIVSQS